MIIKTMFKDSRRIKELEIMFKMQSLSAFLNLAKFADIRGKNPGVSRTQGMGHVICVFLSSFGKLRLCQDSSL